MIDLSGPRTSLVTAFGTTLYFDGASGELRHGAVERGAVNAGFVGDTGAPDAGRGWLIHDLGPDGACAPIVCQEDRCRSLLGSGAGPRVPTLLERVPLERGLVAFSAGGRFLSASPDGRVTLSTPTCSTWELFVASEPWCGETPAGGAAAAAWSSHPAFDRQRIAGYLVHPLTRVRAGTAARAAKVLVYGYPRWSHGRVYHDLCQHLHRRGYVVDVLDWQQDHGGHFAELGAYYDLFLTALDGVRTLTDVYRVPLERIIALSHHELDMRMLVEQKGTDVFRRFAAYGVVSEFLYARSLMLGLPRVPLVASLGVNRAEFHAEVAERLGTVGYASSMAVTTYGVEWKRGALAEAAAREAGLAFRVAGSTADQIHFLDMPDFYRGVDAVVTSSVSESGPLSVLEAAAAGRLVIGTPVGHFPVKAYQGGGILAPLEAGPFTRFVADTLRYYKDNPSAYVDKCRAIQEASRRFDWDNTIDEWIELIETARGFAGAAAAAPTAAADDSYEFTADWFSRNIPVWQTLIARLKPARILEIGSFEGRSTAYLIENAGLHQPLEICCVDTWQGGVEHDRDAMGEVERRFDHNVAVARRRARHAAEVRKIKKLSTQALAELLARGERPFDLVYVDGSHQAPDVLADAVLGFQLVRVGGLMIFDDYLWHLEPRGSQDLLTMPKPAIDAFVNLYQRKLQVLADLPIWQLYVEKTA